MKLQNFIQSSLTLNTYLTNIIRTSFCERIALVRHHKRQLQFIRVLQDAIFSKLWNKERKENGPDLLMGPQDESKRNLRDAVTHLTIYQGYIYDSYSTRNGLFV